MEMDKEYLNKIIQTGYRPCVMAVLVFDRKIAVFSSNKYPGYYLVQGGIEPYESPLEAVEREIVEELGYSFYSKCLFPPRWSEYLFEDKMESKNIKDKIIINGLMHKAKGKHYFIFAIDVSKNDIPQIAESDYGFTGSSVEYQKVEWLLPKEALRKLETNTNPIKREISKRAIREYLRITESKN